MSLSVVHKLGDEGWEAHYDLPPKEAVRAAYSQFERDDWNTWNYEKYDYLVTEGHFTVSCGDFVAWKKGKPSKKEVHEYMKANHAKARAARAAQSD